MSKRKTKSQLARQLDRVKTPLGLSKRSNSAPNPDNPDDLMLRDRGKQAAKGWSDWLNKQPAPQQKHPENPVIHADISGVTTVSTVKPCEIGASGDDPAAHADVENDIIETGKEKIMQTAKQEDTVSENNGAARIDLRDMSSAKLSTLKDNAKPALQDDIGSLFGPAIEDDVKGVRSQIRELIQCEMQGELGQRFSRNLRIVIRREIAAAIDDQFDRV